MMACGPCISYSVGSSSGEGDGKPDGAPAEKPSGREWACLCV